MRLTCSFRKVLLFHISVCSDLLYLDSLGNVEDASTLIVKSFLTVGKFLQNPSKCFVHDNSRNKK